MFHVLYTDRKNIRQCEQLFSLMNHSGMCLHFSWKMFFLAEYFVQQCKILCVVHQYSSCCMNPWAYMYMCSGGLLVGAVLLGPLQGHVPHALHWLRSLPPSGRQFQAVSKLFLGHFQAVFRLFPGRFQQFLDHFCAMQLLQYIVSLRFSNSNLDNLLSLGVQANFSNSFSSYSAKKFRQFVCNLHGSPV